MVAAVSAAGAIGGALISSSASRSASSAAADSNATSTAAASQAQADRLAFDKQVYSDGAADRTFASDMARTTATNQAQDRTKYNALQDEQIARGKVYQGVEDTMLRDAQTYDTQARREAAAGTASADVQTNIDAQRGSTMRNMQRMGVNPSSGASMAMNGIMDIQGASARAGAANAARKQIETLGYARKMDAVGLGKGLVGNQATQAGLGLQSGNSAVGNSLVPLNVSSAANSAMSQGFGNAASGFATKANLQGNNFYNQQLYGMGVGQQVGSMLGSMAKSPWASGLGSAITSWMTPSNADTVIPMQPGGGY